MKVFIDTSAFIALFVRSERQHSLIAKQYEDYRRCRARFYTSDYILDELLTRLMYDLGKGATQKILTRLNQAISKEEILVLHVDSVSFERAKTVFLKYADYRISFTDATTSVLFRDLALDEIFTLDSDFRKMHLRTSP